MCINLSQSARWTSNTNHPYVTHAPNDLYIPRVTRLVGDGVDLGSCVDDDEVELVL